MVWTQLGDNIVGEATGDYSGGSVSLSSDGNRVAIGARFNDANGLVDSGHVRVYEYINSIWQQLGDDIQGEAASNYSGISVSLSEDGSILAIGSSYGGPVNGGYVRIYQYFNSVWQQLGTDIDGETSGSTFGCSVSLSANGYTVAIGSNVNNGLVKVYEYINGNWQILGSSIFSTAQPVSSTLSVSLNADGSTVVVGIKNESVRGVTRVYKYITDTWQKLGEDIIGEDDYDYSGISVSINASGNIIAIGAQGNNGNGNNEDSGHVRVYKYENYIWTQLGVDIDGESSFDYSGTSVSINSEGNIVAIGAFYNDGTNGENSGHVRVYQYIESNWTKIGEDIDGDATGDCLGYSVSLSANGHRLAAGANFSVVNDMSTVGHTKVFKLLLDPGLNNFSIPSKNNGDEPFTITPPNTNSDGTFIYSSSNPLVATIINGNVIQINGVGTTTITATQNATFHYISHFITADFTVNPEVITITIEESVCNNPHLYTLSTNQLHNRSVFKNHDIVYAVGKKNKASISRTHAHYKRLGKDHDFISTFFGICKK